MQQSKKTYNKLQNSGGNSEEHQNSDTFGDVAFVASKSSNNNKISFSILCLPLLIFLLMFLYFFYYMLVTAQIFPTEMASNGWLRLTHVDVTWETTPLILTWNTYFGLGSTMNILLKENNVSMCPFKCLYSDERKEASNATIIIFHMRNSLLPLPEHRTPGQYYAFFSLESPPHTNRLEEVPPNFFNFTISYRADGALLYPYDWFQVMDENELAAGLIPAEQRWTEEEIEKKIAVKKELALNFISNCHSESQRQMYIEEMKKYMNISQFGACVGRETCRDDDCVNKYFDEHFFYLAFENSVCLNYVTEKFWNIKRLIVPVVLTRKVFKNLEKEIPSDSFIAADDFGSVKELSEHLKLVASDKKLYKSYFRWTKTMKRSKHGEDVMNPLCQLCKIAHEHPPLQIDDISKFWIEGGNCQQNFVSNVLLAGK